MVFVEKTKLKTAGIFLLPAFFAMLPVLSIAGGFYVDHEKGNNSGPGTFEEPFETINHAVNLAGAGDTIHLMPTNSPYLQSADLINKSGNPGSPITIDGHGATLSGSEPIDPNDWEQVSPGLYRSEELYRKTSHGSCFEDSCIDAVAQRYFFIFDGRVNRMGRSSKGVIAPFKDPCELEVGEWTFVKPEIAFYIKIDPCNLLTDYNIEAPLRSNGVTLYKGLSEYITIRNVNCEHVYNDGFVVHGDSTAILLENIRSAECGDDGMSLADTANDVYVDGFYSVANSTGIVLTGDANAVCNRALLCANHGVGVLVIQNPKLTLNNSLVITGTGKPIVVDGDQDTGWYPKLALLNSIVFSNQSQEKIIEVNRRGTLSAKQCTFSGVNIAAGSNADEIRLEQCIIGGEELPVIQISSPDQWHSSANIFGFSELHIGPDSYVPDVFQVYLSKYEPDGQSKWCNVYLDYALNIKPRCTSIAPGIGASVSALPFTGSVNFCPTSPIDFDYLLRFSNRWLESSVFP